MPDGRRRFVKQVNQNTKQLQALLAEAVEQTGAWSAIIMVPSFEKEIFTILESVNLPPGWNNIYNSLDKNTYCGTCFLTKEIQVIQGQLLKQPAGATEFHTVSAITMVPIAGDDVRAVLEVLSDKEGFRFTDKDVQVLTAAAKEIAKFI
jgi:hypothetical protein